MTDVGWEELHAITVHNERKWQLKALIHRSMQLCISQDSFVQWWVLSCDFPIQCSSATELTSVDDTSVWASQLSRDHYGFALSLKNSNLAAEWYIFNIIFFVLLIFYLYFYAVSVVQLHFSDTALWNYKPHAVSTCVSINK